MSRKINQEASPFSSVDHPVVKIHYSRHLKLGTCCDLTFRAESGLISILERLHILKVLMHANATIMFKDYRYSL